MAPGCYSPSSAKESSPNHTKSIVSNEPSTSESNLGQTINDSEDVYSILKTSSSTASSDRIINQIPLPSTPPPPNNMLLLHGEDDEEDDQDEEEDQQGDSTDESEDEESEEEEEDEEEEESDDDEADEEEDNKKKEGKDHLLKVTSPRLKSVGRSANLIFDTVDTFEILEQTIIKQKRLAKLKNTDLRRKVLLKRTFDRVLEIMDAENGFNDNDDLSLPPSATVSTTTTVAATTQSNNSIDETEKSLNVLVLEQQQSIDSFELELHPDPSSPMDDSDNEEESGDSKHKDEIFSTTSTTTATTTPSTTLVKLVDMPTSSTVVDLESSTALVPRQVKRRSSASDDEEDEDEDEDENHDEDDRNDQSALDETCFYEYSMTHLMNDQQLNFNRSKLDRHERRPSKASDELNLYCNSVDLQVVNEQANSLNLQRPSNHPRKKLRMT